MGNMRNTSLWGRRIWQPTCWRAKGNEDTGVSWGSEYYNNRPVTYNTPTSHCRRATVTVFVYPRPTIYPLRMLWDEVWVCTFWSYFGLTFRVSLRLISLFSSISSCSLRAAENERTSVTLRVQAHASSACQNVWKLLKWEQTYNLHNVVH